MYSGRVTAYFGRTSLNIISYAYRMREARSPAFVAMLNGAEAEGEANGFIFAEAVAASLDAIIAEAGRTR
jgi:hypothetical protein